VADLGKKKTCKGLGKNRGKTRWGRTEAGFIFKVDSLGLRVRLGRAAIEKLGALEKDPLEEGKYI